VAHALPRTNPDPGSPAGPDATAVVPAGAVIRAVPSARPEADAPPAVEAPAPSPAPADPPATAEPATRGRRQRKTAGGPGARELRRQETRAKIVDAAAELFAERGFDAVSVMEIARRAGVVEKTVFNHFPVKEGLVFDADPLGSPEAATGLAQMARVIRGSRTLQVREREILGELTNALAQLIAEETGAQGDQVEPWLAAHAVLGLYASLLELARDRVLAGVGGLELSAELRRQGRRGLSLLQFGLAGYAKRR
jgi:hypothetical protein